VNIIREGGGRTPTAEARTHGRKSGPRMNRKLVDLSYSLFANNNLAIARNKECKTRQQHMSADQNQKALKRGGTEEAEEIKDRTPLNLGCDGYA